MRALWIVCVVGCGGTAAKLVEKPTGPDPAVIARAAGTFIQAANHGDAAAIEAMLDEPFQLGGVWFEEPSCREFGRPARVLHDKFPALAKCLATLRLHPGGRNPAWSTGTLVTYGPGIELELRFFIFESSTWLTSIGPIAHREGDDSIPTISPALFDSLRTTREAPTNTADRLRPEMTGHDYVFAWLKVCLDASGNAAVESRDATSQVVSDVFSDVAKAWKFNPLVLGGEPSPACSFVRLVYPAGKGPSAEDIPIPRRPSWLVAPKVLDAQREGGPAGIVPDDVDWVRFYRAGGRQASGAFKYCIDDTGKTELVNVLRSTGIPNYDRKIVRTMATWKYTPFKVDGVPKPICSVHVFTYTQN
jgi:hypothetical protein